MKKEKSQQTSADLSFIFISIITSLRLGANQPQT
jgi:hypothetical protein